MNNPSLNTLAMGESAYVQGVEAETAMSRRLMDLGLICGTRVTCVLRNRTGDLAAYSIRGAVIALRKEDARGVLLHSVQFQ